MSCCEQLYLEQRFPLLHDLDPLTLRTPINARLVPETVGADASSPLLSLMFSEQRHTTLLLRELAPIIFTPASKSFL